MADKDDCVELVKQAQLGNKECLDRLAELANMQLRAYVYRLTLADDVTQDILQETMVEMFKFLNKLRRADRFWPWLRRIAANKVHRHYKLEQRRRTVPISEIGYKDTQKNAKNAREAVAELVSQELKQVVFRAMHQLRPRYRHILVLRCYEEMKYSEIAKEMDCSEFGARRLFFRAKRSLVRELSRRGFGRGSLLVALVLFGKMTASSEAAATQVSLTAATTKVGVAAGLAALAGSKTAIISLATAGALAVGTTMVTTSPTDEKRGASLEKPPRNLQVMGQTTKADKEYWYYFPKGKNGPVIMRLMNRNSRRNNYYCAWMQDEEANYYFDRGKNILYINNYRQWHRDRSVWRLPTDNVALGKFLSQVQACKEPIDYVSGDGKGFLVVVEHDKHDNLLWISHHQNLLHEEYFQYNWTTDVEVVDNRDPMHKRGWTYFRISGQMNGKEVSGTGRIPFVCGSSDQNSAWLKLQVGDDLRIMDSGAEARVYDATGHVLARYKGGSFFAGLGRPWMGLHTIDTVRRDAAEKQVWFETIDIPKSDRAEVVLTCDQTKLLYTIDLERDVIDKISFSASNGGAGELTFSYLQDIHNVGNEFAEPRRKSPRRPQLKVKEPGVLWLVRLAEGGLVSELN